MAHLKPECGCVKDIVAGQFERLEKVRVLEAGCGSNAAFEMQDNAYVVGLDISEQQLKLNDGLDEKHLGDLQYYTFSSESFDLIVCWNVLEHLLEPERALKNMYRWLAPGGIMILALPNVLSATGFATKFTPFWFHVWFYRNILKYENAGRYGNGPFRTFLSWSISMPRLLRFAEEHDLSVRFSKLYSTCGGKGRGRGLEFFLCLASIPVEILTFRRISAFNGSIMLVLENNNPKKRLG